MDRKISILLLCLAASQLPQTTTAAVHTGNDSTLQTPIIESHPSVFETTSEGSIHTLIWTPNLSAGDGRYRLFVWYGPQWASLGVNSPYLLTHKNGRTEIAMSPDESPEQWIALGTFDLGAGSHLRFQENPEKSLRSFGDAALFYTESASVTTTAVSGVSIAPHSLLLDRGETAQLSALVTPSDATNPAVVWTTSNPSIAKVSDTGQVRGLAKGSTTITVTTDDGDFHDTCAVTVSGDGAILLGYWPLDGNLEDASGNLEAGIFRNNPKYSETLPLRFTTDAVSGKAIDLRGDGRRQMPFVETGLVFPDDAVKTYSVFVKTTDFATELVWIGNGAPDTDGNFDNRCYLGTEKHSIFVGAGRLVHRQTKSQPYPSEDGKWHHYALVVGNSIFRVYQDGNLLKITPGGDLLKEYFGTTASSLATGAYGTPRTFLIGMGGGQSNHPANAIIDDVAVFSGALTQNEIKAIAEAGNASHWLPDN